MKTSKKFKIGNINVQSFITNAIQINKTTLKGGQTGDYCLRPTTIPDSNAMIFCTSTATLPTKGKSEKTETV